MYVAELLVLALASLIVMLTYYIIRLLIRGVRPLPFLKKMIPLLRENARIASAFDAVPYNIRYCAKTYGFNRKRIEKSAPVLAQINLDGNCYLITVIAMLCIAMASTPLSIVDTAAVGILVLLLSLGAPNQPGSCLVGLTIVMIFLQADDLTTIALIAEVFLGGVLNLVNLTGDVVTMATEEVRVVGTADGINSKTME
jgi:Na+/H+-dicarboxylate symporter